MATKNLNTRIVNKHDIEVNWLNCKTPPYKGEIIIYDIEVDENGNTLDLPEGRTTPYTYERLKIGDGKNLVKDLPFYAASADDVYFDGGEDGLVTTKAIGHITLTDGMATLVEPNERKSLKELWDMIFVGADDDGISNPYISVSVSGGEQEVGTKITPKISISTNPGKYKYGSKNSDGTITKNTSTGVTFPVSSMSISCTSPDSLKASNTGSSSLTLGEVQYTDGDDENLVTINYSCTAGYTNSNCTPLSKLGKEKEPIKANSCTEGGSCTFEGYRKMFIGCLTEEKESFTEEEIRSLTVSLKKNSSYSSANGVKASREPQEFKVPAGTKQIIIAYPMALTGVTQNKPKFEAYSKAFNKFSEEDEKNISKTANPIKISGNNGYKAVDYYVCAYSHANTFSVDVDYKITV